MRSYDETQGVGPRSGRDNTSSASIRRSLEFASRRSGLTGAVVAARVPPYRGSYRLLEVLNWVRNDSTHPPGRAEGAGIESAPRSVQELDQVFQRTDCGLAQSRREGKYVDSVADQATTKRGGSLEKTRPEDIRGSSCPAARTTMRPSGSSR